MPETDKTYVKKYKINDMLNDLFTAISQNKPENPLEFAIKHLESKLPTKSDSNEEKLKKNFPTLNKNNIPSLYDNE